MKSRKILLIVLGILLSLSLIVGASYAYYMVTASQTNKNHLASSCISVSLTNEKNDITLNNAYPITDSEGKKLTPYQFTITNTCDIFISYNVNLEMLEGTDLSSDYIKTMINNEASAILSSLDSAFITIDKSTESRTLAQGSLGSNDSVDYTLKLWMDENTPLNDDTQDKSLISKIVVVAQPSTYKPVDYVSTLHDALLINEYAVTDVNNAITKIESKTTPDLSQTAPIIVWSQKINNNATATGKKISINIIGKEEYKAENLNEKDNKLLLGLGYTFDSSTGVYSLTNTNYYDPSELDYKSKDYYYCNANVKFSSDGVPSTWDDTTGCFNIYKVDSVSLSTSSYNDINDYYINYTIQGTNLSRVEETLDKSDKGIYESTDDLGTTYYYRGNVLNNNVYFGGYYWKVVRINGDGSIRLLYIGKSLNEDSSNIGNSPFNSNYDNPAYAGYMYGETTGTRENNIKNEVDSTIKAKLDSWYKENIVDKNLEMYVGDAGFCNDRSLTSGDGASTSTSSYFGAYSRIMNNAPIFTCPDTSNDLFTTLEASIGNKSLKYPIGLITVDELVFAGINNNITNKYFYAYSTNIYWTMSTVNYSPYHSSVLQYFQRGTSGRISSDKINYNFEVRPVINLKADVEISDGIGTVNDPFIIKNN